MKILVILAALIFSLSGITIDNDTLVILGIMLLQMAGFIILAEELEKIKSLIKERKDELQY